MIHLILNSMIVGVISSMVVGGRTVSGLREELEQGVGMGMLCTGTVLNGHEEEPQHR